MASHEFGTRNVGEFRLRRTGLVLFASILLIIAGAFHALQGLAALTNGKFFTVVTDYAYDLDIEGWGWVHLFAGVILLLTGIGLYRGAQFAWLTAMLVIIVMAMVNFVFIPFQPFWAITLLVMDGLILWALLTQVEDTE
jgi:hypothetical protein